MLNAVVLRAIFDPAPFRVYGAAVDVLAGVLDPVGYAERLVRDLRNAHIDGHRVRACEWIGERRTLPRPHAGFLPGCRGGCDHPGVGAPIVRVGTLFVEIEGFYQPVTPAPCVPLGPDAWLLISAQGRLLAR